MKNEVPKYYETFIPILETLNANGVMRSNDLDKAVRDKYYGHLSPELLNQRVKTGAILILNRIGWGKAYLKQAGMVMQPERAMMQITDKGRNVLRLGSLTLKELLSDKDFLKNRKVGKEDRKTEEVNEEASPQDMIDAGFRKIENQTKLDLLEKLKGIDPYYFEKIVLKLIKAMGYGDFIETKKSNDGGIDGIIDQDQLGIEKIYVQAKRYDNNKVREIDIRNFIGAMSGDTQKGIFVTTSCFDEKAIKKASTAHHKIILIDGQKIVDLMYKYGVGIQIKNTYEIKELDEDFFEGE